MSTLSLPGQTPSPLQSPILSEVGSNARLEEEEEEGRRKVHVYMPPFRRTETPEERFAVVNACLFFQRYPTDKAYFIAKEILTTERTYLKDLEVITVVSGPLTATIDDMLHVCSSWLFPSGSAAP